MTRFLGGTFYGLITGVVISLAYKTPEYKKSQLNMKARF
jgi:hypothetical protein